MTDAREPGAGQPGALATRWQVAPGDIVPAAGGAAAGGPGNRLIDWANRRWVLLGGLAMIVVVLVWRLQFLGHMYFSQDDYENLDFAIKSPLNWHYLSFIGWGHFMVGPRFVFWLVARVSLYDWPLAVAVVATLFGCASLAALWLLRTLFGERPAILIPLAAYLLCPLTLPSLGFWSVALESVPLQLAIFMALNAHVRYVRTRRTLYLVAAAGWLTFGLIFFEKALVLPPLLFAVTAAFLIQRPTWLAGASQALRDYSRAWVTYAGLLAVYTILFVVALPTSQYQPQAPPSAGAVLTFCWDMVKDTLLPGAVGGPWQWYPVAARSLAAAPAELTWLAMIVAVTVVAASVVRRKIAWRSWVIFAGWVFAADMIPVILARINWYPVLRALDAHYLSDAVPVLAICLGLAFLPLAGDQPVTQAAPSRSRHRSAGEGTWQQVAAGLLAVFVFGSWWSARAYQAGSSGGVIASYMANARRAITLAPPGMRVLDTAVPPKVLYTLNARSLASHVIGVLAPGKMRWIDTPTGTVDGLRMFGPDGRLYLAQVEGAGSPAGKPCWPQQHGQILVRFWKFSPTLSTVLRISYVWRGAVGEQVTVRYGSITRVLQVQPGPNVGYLPVTGSANNILVSGVSGANLCVGDAEAGAFGPDTAAPAIPAPHA